MDAPGAFPVLRFSPQAGVSELSPAPGADGPPRDEEAEMLGLFSCVPVSVGVGAVVDGGVVG
ncbi:hypothetical protein EAO70_31735, partial [Streptomyces sp. adm13(2018)]